MSNCWRKKGCLHCLTLSKTAGWNLKKFSLPGTGNKHPSVQTTKIFGAPAVCFQACIYTPFFSNGFWISQLAQNICHHKVKIQLMRSSFLHSQSLDMVSELKPPLKYCQQKQNALLGTSISHTSRHFWVDDFIIETCPLHFQLAMVVTQISFYFDPYLGKMKPFWNHQLVEYWPVFSFYWESSVAEISFQKINANHKDNMIDCEIALAMKIIVRFLHKLNQCCFCWQYFKGIFNGQVSSSESPK